MTTPHHHDYVQPPPATPVTAPHHHDNFSHHRDCLQPLDVASMKEESTKRALMTAHTCHVREKRNIPQKIATLVQNNCCNIGEEDLSQETQLVLLEQPE